MRQVGREEAIRKFSYILKRRLSGGLLRDLGTPMRRYDAIELLAAYLIDDLPWELLTDGSDYPSDGISGRPAR